jgi:hypothetical protein
MAMMSKWMAQGNVLSYMADNSPCSDYAIPFVRHFFSSGLDAGID